MRQQISSIMELQSVWAWSPLASLTAVHKRLISGKWKGISLNIYFFNLILLIFESFNSISLTNKIKVIVLTGAKRWLSLSLIRFSHYAILVKCLVIAVFLVSHFTSISTSRGRLYTKFCTDGHFSQWRYPADFGNPHWRDWGLYLRF